MKYLYSILLLCLVLACSKKQKTFDSLEFSFCSTFNEVYSMKITNNDTIYVYHHWMSMDFHSGKTPFKLYQMYAGVMCENDRKKLDKLIGSDGLNLFLPNYYENFEDGSFYAINLVKENTDKTIFVHARNVPAALDSLAGFLYDLKHRILLKPVNKTISFKTAGAVVPPPIKLDLIKQQ